MKFRIIQTLDGGGGDMINDFETTHETLEFLMEIVEPRRAEVVSVSVRRIDKDA